MRWLAALMVIGDGGDGNGDDVDGKGGGSRRIRRSERGEWCKIMYIKCAWK